jgi:CRP-like cAMP-binding protein
MGWRANWLADRLSQEFCTRHAAHLHPVVLAEKEALSEIGTSPAYLYFPISCGIVQLSELESGASTAVSITGWDGVVNLESLFGATNALWTNIVVNRGTVVKLPLREVREEFSVNAEFRATAMRGLHYRMIQLSQIATCYQHHSIEQKLCRWLLTVQDHAGGDVIQLTHQTIASQLGLRREAVSVAARALQEQQLIRNARGNITVMDRIGLELCSCECYHSLRRERGRLRPIESNARLFEDHYSGLRAA